MNQLIHLLMEVVVLLQVLIQEFMGLQQQQME